METTILLLFLAASAMLKNTISQGSETYRILPFEASTGLYYEYQGVMRRRVSTWRITSFLDTQKLCLGLEAYKSRLTALTAMCQPMLGAECQQLIKSFHLESKWEAAYKLHQEITHEAEELNRRTDAQLPAHLPQGLRRRRTTPMLGFLGGIVGPVAGLLTYDDGQQIEDEINNLNQVAANLSHLVGKQTHVVRAQFEEIQGRFNIYEERQKELKHQLTEIQKGMYEMSSSVFKLEYSRALSNTLHVLEAGLDEHLRAADRLLEIIHYARRGQLHPSLLTTEKLQPIYRDVQDHAPAFAFPVPGPKINVEDLAQAATTTISCRNKTLRVCLDVPLLEKTDYNLYGLHSVPVIQSILKNGSGRAYVRSEFSHLAMADSQRTYLLMKEKEMEQCKELRGFYMCPENLPVRETSTYASCEISLLNNPTAESFRLCEVQVTYRKRPFFKLLETLGGWIYSFLTKTAAEITCPARRTSKIQLNGVGIVQIAPGCYLRTSGLSLPSPGSRAQVSVVTYEPYLHLNLSELSPVLLQNKQLLTLTPTSKKQPEDNPTEESRFENTDETLNKLEDQLNEISSQEHRRTKQTILTHGSYVGIGLLSIGLITYFGRAKLITAVTNWRPCPKRKGKAEDQPAIRLAEEPAGNQAADSHSDEFRIEQRCTTTTNTPAPKNRTAPISTSTSKAATRLPAQSLQPM